MKLRDEIAQCAIGVTEMSRHFSQRLAFHHDRAERLVASLQRHLRFEEKLSAQAVVHDLPPNCHSFFGETVGKAYSQNGVGHKGEKGGPPFGPGNSAVKRMGLPRPARPEQNLRVVEMGARWKMS